MNQLIYTPFGALNQLHRELARAFDEPFTARADDTSYEVSHWAPQVDIKESATEFRVVVDVPGVAHKDVDITLDRNLLTIKGSRNTETETEDNGYKRRERISGNFVRQFTLPDSADGDAITAKVVNGVLEISIPKGEASKPRSITVDAA